jgi:hypothetical protein
MPEGATRAIQSSPAGSTDRVAPGFSEAPARPATAAAAAVRTPAPAATPGNRIGREDDVLAAIVRSIAVPGSELGIAAPLSPEPVAVPAPPPAAPPPPAATPVEAAATSPVRAAPKGNEVAKAEPVRTRPEPPKPEPKAGSAKAASRKAEAKTPEPKKPEAKKSAPKPPAEPARWWVQVAGGANVADLPKAWNALTAKSAALKGRQAWTTPLRFTNRLLTGPFATAGEAQAFVNKLGGGGLSAFTFESEAGQKVTRLPAR